MQDTPGFLALWHLVIPGLFTLGLFCLAFYASRNRAFKTTIGALILGVLVGYVSMFYFMVTDHATLDAIVGEGIQQMRMVMMPLEGWVFTGVAMSTILALPIAVLWSLLIYATRPRRPFYWQKK